MILAKARPMLDELKKGPWPSFVKEIEKSAAKNFLVSEDNETLIPSFRTIDGLGDTVANNIVEERIDAIVDDALEETNEKIDSEIRRATDAEELIDGQLIDSSKNYTINANGGLELILKNGKILKVNFDGNFGQI